MNRFVRVTLLALPLIATVTFGCARSKRTPTVIGPKPTEKEKPGPATPSPDQGGGDKYSGSGGQGDQGAQVPTDKKTTPNPDSSKTAGNGATVGSNGGGNTNAGGNGNTGNNGNSGNNNGNNNGFPGNNGTPPTDAEIQAHVRRIGTWDTGSDRLPTGFRYQINETAQ